MRFLRTASTRRLLAAVAGLLVAIAAGSAIAIAATSAGPKPPRTTLPRAIHRALTGPTVAGITAHVTFTNHLIDSGDLQGTSPLLSGSAGRLWLSPGHGMRLELQSQNGNDAQIIVDKGAFWAYDPSSNTVYRGALPMGNDTTRHPAHAGNGVPTVADIQSSITQLAGKVLLSGAIPGDVAGRATYTVKLSPADTGGRLDRVEVSWDAANAVPLRLAVYAKGDPTPVLGLAADSVSYAAVPASSFIRPRTPAGAKVVDLSLPAQSDAAHTGKAGTGRKGARTPEVTGAAAVAKHLSFPLDAPASAGGRTLSEVRLLGRGTHAAALLSYGQGLGGVYVVERKATGKNAAVAAPKGDRAGLTLPSVTLRGASGQELDTALGSVLTFTRGGVGYTVAGSVPPSAVKAVAGSL